MSGHSKWATIKRKKGAIDAARGKLFTKLIREVVIAARGGGGDPSGNPRLRKAIQDARSNQMTNDTIQRAIKRGTGEIEGVSYDEVLYEGTGPGGTLFLVEGTTDNRNRSAAELRKIFDRHAGALAGSGSASWAFTRRGVIELAKEVSEDRIMETAVDAGADDYEDTGDVWLVYTTVEDFARIIGVLEAAGITPKNTRLAYIPNAKKEVRGRDAEVCLNLVDALDEHDDVATVYADFDIPDDEMTRISEQG
ncbi:MAG TPA: YebC/PmpR family DNA-binding transcriptional regulator [Polyangiaceae bacterium]|jgi:YebC/PmpR family DNA-binding regulatory protein|nr:YebC/PmpR family DNA-binding transcriptional regulator [Polyangiaceae bacterium]